jgi:hypothetical protein
MVRILARIICFTSVSKIRIENYSQYVTGPELIALMMEAASLKRRPISTILHGATSQKTIIIFIYGLLSYAVSS